MHCILKKTLDTIVETKNHYIVAVKKNSHALYNISETITDKLTNNTSYFKTKETSHGRFETRAVHVFEASAEMKEKLPHVQSLVRVYRTREKNEKKSEEKVYYCSDLKLSAKKFNEAIREHWSIENKLHWVKDKVMDEDRAANHNKRSAEVISILKSFVIQIAYLNSSSVINFQRTIAHNIEQMYILLE